MLSFIRWVRITLFYSLLLISSLCSAQTDVVLFGVGNLGKTVVLEILKQSSPVRIVAAFRKHAPSLSDSHRQLLWTVVSKGPHYELSNKYRKNLDSTVLDGVRLYRQKDFEEWFSVEYGSDSQRSKPIAILVTESGGSDLFDVISRCIRHGMHVITSAQELYHLSINDIDNLPKSTRNPHKKVAKLTSLLQLAQGWKRLNELALRNHVSIQVFGLQDLWLSELSLLKQQQTRSEETAISLKSLYNEESIMISMECNADLVSEYWNDYMIGHKPVEFQDLTRSLKATQNLEQSIRSFLYHMSDEYMIDQNADVSISHRRMRFSSVPLTDPTGDGMSIYLMRNIETNRMTGVTYSGRLTWNEEEQKKSKDGRKSVVKKHREVSLFVKIALLNRWQRKDKNERESMQACRISYDLNDDGQPEIQINQVHLWKYAAQMIVNSTIELDDQPPSKMGLNLKLDDNKDDNSLQFWQSLNKRISTMEGIINSLENIMKDDL